MAVRRKYCLIITLYLLACGLRVNAQDTLNFAKVDSVSYGLYAEKKWTELGKYARYAVKQGYDYYYLHIRAGIAYFEKQNYREAAIEFEKALTFNTGDDLANEYLYYAYLYAGYFEKARWLSKSFDSTFASYMKTSNLSPIAFVMAEGGVKISDSTNRFKNAVYGQVAIGHYVGRQVSLFHAFSYYKQNEDRFNVQQFQYYIGAAVPLKHNLAVSGGFHIIYDNADVKAYNRVETVTTATETNVGQPGSPPPPPGTHTVAIHSFSLQPYYVGTQILGCVGAVTLTRHTSLFDFSIGTTGSFLDTVKQYQLNGGITWYPFKNNKLAIGGNVYVHDATRVGKVSVAIVPSVAVAVTKKLYAAIAYFNNNGLNIAEQNGYLVNNSPDYTTERYTASLSYAIFKKVYIYGTYAFEKKSVLTGTFKYNYNIFLLGIKVVPS